MKFQIETRDSAVTIHIRKLKSTHIFFLIWLLFQKDLSKEIIAIYTPQVYKNSFKNFNYFNISFISRKLHLKPYLLLQNG